MEGEIVSMCPPCFDRTLSVDKEAESVPTSVYRSRIFDHKGVRYAAEIRGHVESWEFIYKVAMINNGFHVFPPNLCFYFVEPQTLLENMALMFLLLSGCSIIVFEAVVIFSDR